MKRRKFLRTSAALVAIGAGVFLLISREDADERPVEILLRAPSTAVAIPAQPAVHLAVPRRYIAPRTSLSEAKSGVEKLFLEIELAEASPLRIELTPRDPFPNGLGDRRRDEALNQPPGSPKQLIVPPTDQPQDMIGYLFTNSYAGAMAYYFKTNDDGVFVDCSERPRCRGYLTWHGLLDVQYEYERADLDDPRPINATLQKLLESFEPTAVPLPQLSDQSRDEQPIFEPVSAN
jgi:hypothetical protein